MRDMKACVASSALACKTLRFLNVPTAWPDPPVASSTWAHPPSPLAATFYAQLEGSKAGRVLEESKVAAAGRPRSPVIRQHKTAVCRHRYLVASEGVLDL